VPGRGIFVEILLELLAERGAGPVRLTAMATDLPDTDEAAELAALAEELDAR
jgi:hypothetical protein